MKQTAIAFSIKAGKETKAVSVNIADDVLAVVSAGMVMADSLDTYWKDNCEEIAAAFWGDLPSAEGLTRAKFKDAIRKAKSPFVEGVEAFTVACQVFTQQHPKFQFVIAARAAMAGMKDKKSAEYDKERTFETANYDRAKSAAWKQVDAVIGHLVNAHFDQGATGDSRKPVYPEDILMAAQQELREKLATKRAPYDEDAVRVRTVKYIEQLSRMIAKQSDPTRGDDADNRSIAAPKPGQEPTDGTKGQVLTPAEYKAQLKREQAEAKAAAKAKAQAEKAAARAAKTQAAKEARDRRANDLIRAAAGAVPTATVGTPVETK